MDAPAPAQLAQAVEVFAAAFFDDPLHAHFFPAPNRRAARLRALYAYKLASCADRLRILPSCSGAPCPAGAAIWVPPGMRPGTPFRPGMLPELWRLLALVPPAAFARLVRYERFSRGLHRSLAAAPHFYLEILAVAPACQGQGLASRLVRPALEQADRAGLPCYLETQNPRNLPLYAHYGFRLQAQLPVPGSAVIHYALIRPSAP
jgi:GNAT superfamily N-acetyltransferase